MTDKNGDDEKQTWSRTYLWGAIQVTHHYHYATSKIALGNLYLQKELENSIELTRDEHAKLIDELQKLHERAGTLAPLSPSRCSPPAVAAFLLAFIAPKNTVQPFLGDLEEMFHENVARLGEGQAKRKYWMQVAASVGPLLWQWLKRIGFFTVLVDYFRSKFGL